MCGLVKKTSGTIRLFGVDLDVDPLRPRYDVGLVPQEVNFDPFFTVSESLRIQLGYYARPPDEARIREVLEALSLSEKANAQTRALSGGMKRRLLIAKALVHRPKLVFLDEPTAGVDVELRRDLWAYVRRLRSEGTTVILTTHYLEEAEELADRVGVIDSGRLLLVEDKAALLRRLGEKRVLITFSAPVGALPAALEGKAVLAEDRRSLVVTERNGLPRAGEVLAAPLRRRVPGGGGGHPGEPAGGRVRRGAARRGWGVNLLGLRTLFWKEVRRFLRVPGQTVLSPLISTTLYFVVFGVSLGGRMEEATGQPYLPFIVPGLVFLGLANNAFLNTSSSLFIMKIQGTIVDLLVAPLGPGELLLGFVGGGMVRGLAVGLLTWAVALVFAGFQLAHPLVTLGFLLGTAYVFSVLGLVAAVWAEKFEQINFFPTFVMLPLTFLGGVFYSIGAAARAVADGQPLQPHGLHGGGAAVRDARHVGAAARSRWAHAPAARGGGDGRDLRAPGSRVQAQAVGEARRLRSTSARKRRTMSATSAGSSSWSQWLESSTKTLGSSGTAALIASGPSRPRTVTSSTGLPKRRTMAGSYARSDSIEPT